MSAGRSGRGAIYRYRTPHTVELSSRKLSFAGRSHSGGSETQLTASNGDYTYIMYDRIVRRAFGSRGNEPAFSSGPVVARGNRPIWSRVCAGEASVDADAGRTPPAERFVDH